MCWDRLIQSEEPASLQQAVRPTIQQSVTKLTIVTHDHLTVPVPDAVCEPIEVGAPSYAA